MKCLVPLFLFFAVCLTAVADDLASITPPGYVAPKPALLSPRATSLQVNAIMQPPALLPPAPPSLYELVFKEAPNLTPNAGLRFQTNVPLCAISNSVDLVTWWHFSFVTNSFAGTPNYFAFRHPDERHHFLKVGLPPFIVPLERETNGATFAASTAGDLREMVVTDDSGNPHTVIPEADADSYSRTVVGFDLRTNAPPLRFGGVLR